MWLVPSERRSNADAKVLQSKQVKGQSTVPRPHLWASRAKVETGSDGRTMKVIYAKRSELSAHITL